MTPAGASAGEWAHWDLMLGLGADLLPVVCEPNLPIALGSILKDYGKVPSRVLPSGHVVGFPKWTTHVTTDDELGLWSTDPRLGICLQTRLARAIDIDVTDADQVSAILDALRQWFVVDIPVRSRANSTKCLVLYQVPGAIGKSVLPVAHGMIEFLGTGQQCLVAGSHPSGSRYEWDGLLPVSLPVLTPAEDAAMKATLEIQFATGPMSQARVRRQTIGGVACGDPGGADRPLDQVARYLTARGLVQGSGDGGRLDVVCPWVGDHTPGTGGVTSSSYFPAGTGGYETGAFVCLHAHCASKTIGEFLDAVGYLDEGFEVLPDVYTNGFNHATGAMEAVLVLPAPAFELNADKTFIKAKINNVFNWLKWRAECGQWIRYDAFRDEIAIPSPHGSRPFTDADYTRLCRKAEDGIGAFTSIPHDMMRRAVHNLAEDTMFDSARDWIAGLPAWDGVDRLTGFMHTHLGAHADTPDQRAYLSAVGCYFWSAMAGRILDPGSQTDMVVILVSPQGTGKSSAVRAIAPNPSYYTEICLSDSDADRARLTRGKTLVELSELRGLHTKDLESIKAIVTRREDSWTPKYMEMSTTYQRRYLMVGTTNDDHFLADPTGARRWLPIRVGRQDIPAITRDHTQLWAQARDLYQGFGILWKDAQTLAALEHEDFTIQDGWQEDVERYLDVCTQDGICNFVRIGQILQVGLDMKKGQSKRGDEMRVAAILQKLGWSPGRRFNGHGQDRVWVAPDSWHKTTLDNLW